MKTSAIRLKNILLRENDLYRRGEPTSTTDQEWDDFLEELESQIPEADYKAFRSLLTEQTGSNKVTHTSIIGSLSKTKYDEDCDALVEFIKKQHVKVLFLSGKADGASMVLRYENGELVNGATRGDGYEGEDQTDKMILICGSRIAEPFTGEIRGEVILTQEGFEAVNAANNGKYKHPRNALVGIINKKEINEFNLSHVKFVAYNILNSNDTIESKFIRLGELGFKTPMADEIDITPESLTNIKEILKERLLKFRELTPYALDGLVVSDRAWVNEDLFLPKGCVAFKLNDDGVESTVVKVNWELSKSGYMIPIVQIVPIEIDGSTVTNPAGYNYRNILDKEIGTGSKVWVIKSGDIIPKIVQVENPADHVLEFPISCPSCGNDLTFGDVHISCESLRCPSQMQQRVNAFVRKMGVAGASLKSLQAWNINTFDELTAWRPEEDSKSQNKFYDELLEKVYGSSPEDIFANMHWDGWGSSTVHKLIVAMKDQNYADIFQPVVLNTFYFPTGLTREGYEKSYLPMLGYNRNTMLKIVMDQRYSYVESTESSECPLEGMSFCFTGKMERKRPELEALAKDNGAEVKSVSKNLQYLVAGEKAGGKLAKATGLGVTIITEEQFLDMLK